MGLFYELIAGLPMGELRDICKKLSAGEKTGLIYREKKCVIARPLSLNRHEYCNDR